MNTLLLDKYIEEWLGENSRYNNNAVFKHYKSGHIMTGGMIRELEKAKAYAYGVIDVTNAKCVELSDKKSFSLGDTQNRAESMIGNKIAVKRGEVLDSCIQVRVSKEEKALFYKAANGKKLSEWIIETLKKEAEKSN